MSASASSAPSGALLLGPLVIDLVYDADLSGRTMAMLALSSACYMCALAMAQAVIALKGHALRRVGWGIGLVASCWRTWLRPRRAVPRIEIGARGVVVRRGGRVRRVPAAAGCAAASRPIGDSIMEAITDMPFET